MARIILIVFTFSAAVSLVSGTLGECLVKKYVELREPADARILSFIKLDKPLNFIVQFKDQDLTYIRTWIELTNSRMMQAKVRGGTSNKTTHDLPLVFDEGWNKLHLQAVNTRFELTVLLEDGDEATLLDLELDYPIFSVHVEGTFSLCSEGSPEWKVEVGQEVTVPLQPEHNQKLLVTGLGSATPYLVVPSANSDPPKDICANTTLTIKTRRRRSLITVEVFQGSTEDADQALVDADVASPILLVDADVASPILLMGVRNGAVHLRLDLSVPITEDGSHYAGSAGTLTFWPIGFALLFGGMFFGVLLATVVLVCLWRTKRKATSDVANFPRACEKCTQKKSEKTAAPDADSFRNSHETEPLPV